MPTYSLEELLKSGLLIPGLLRIVKDRLLACNRSMAIPHDALYARWQRGQTVCVRAGCDDARADVCIAIARMYRDFRNPLQYNASYSISHLTSGHLQTFEGNSASAAGGIG